MLQFLKPLFVTLVGLALTIYGAVHAVAHNPGLSGFAALWASIPALSATLVFAIGLLALTGGLILLVGGFRGLAQRYRQIRRAFGPARRPAGYGNDDEWTGAYPYH